MEKLLALFLTLCQKTNTLALGLKSVTYLQNQSFSILLLWSINELNNDFGHQARTLHSLGAIMSGQTLKPRKEHPLLEVMTKCDRNRRQPHQTAVSVVESICSCSIILLLLFELIHRDGDVAA